jgi:hypothetical protein
MLESMGKTVTCNDFALGKCIFVGGRVDEVD